MEKLKRLTMIGLIMLLFGDHSVCAEDGVDFEFPADFFNKQIWRGRNLDDDSVLQPGISASYEGLRRGLKVAQLNKVQLMQVKWTLIDEILVMTKKVV